MGFPPDRGQQLIFYTCKTGSFDFGKTTKG
nr:MAG TPA: hypothetical protein [Caudoviricetes sp.]DAZ83266.1 MAG TPA: hypothetical protein [Caudoviricetes sp.]